MAKNISLFLPEIFIEAIDKISENKKWRGNRSKLLEEAILQVVEDGEQLLQQLQGGKRNESNFNYHQ
jgi:metal-responsive CopG/Arc/MetJ family transcriptional regulator